METVLTDLAQRVAKPHTAVVVIDMQNVFCAEGYPPYAKIDKTMIRAMIPRLQQFLIEVRRRKVPIIFIRTVMTEGDFSSPIKELSIRNYGRDVAFCLKDSWEAEFTPEIQPEANEIIIEKTRYSAFVKTDLDARLREMGIATLVMTGVATNICVETTSRDGFMRDYYIVVPDDLVATLSDELHRCSLMNLNRWFATVTSSEELLRLWGD